MSAPTFPVLWQGSREYKAELERFACPRTVPLWLVQQHQTQAMRNHGGQTLAVLASRGGLGPDELVAVLEDRAWSEMPAGASVLALHDLITACSTDGLTPMQIAMARADEVLFVDPDGLGWVPRRWAARHAAGGAP